jgi:crotonobetainyl-CoA:carnitine CoA-transferase CaiB-like acyl-CoA transferase
MMDPALGSVAGRKENEDAIDAEIATWTVGQRHFDVAARLQAAGIPAGPVLGPREQWDDPNFARSGHFSNISRAVIGELPVPHMPARYNGARMEHVSPAPLFDQDTRAILHELAGLDEAEIDALYAAGTCVRVPRGYE